jgi:hypothetical protein
MSASRLLCRLRFCVPFAALSVLVFAGTSLGQATVGTFYDQHVESFSTALPECGSPDLIGTLTGTETTTGHFTATDTGYHFEGTSTFAYRVDFPDGSYVTSVAPAHISFNTTTSGQTTFTQVIQEPRTIYNADGQPIGHAFIHALFHITYSDANGNGDPDAGEVTALVDRFFFTCT